MISYDDIIREVSGATGIRESDITTNMKMSDCNLDIIENATVFKRAIEDKYGIPLHLSEIIGTIGSLSTTILDRDRTMDDPLSATALVEDVVVKNTDSSTLVSTKEIRDLRQSLDNGYKGLSDKLKSVKEKPVTDLGRFKKLPASKEKVEALADGVYSTIKEVTESIAEAVKINNEGTKTIANVVTKVILLTFDLYDQLDKSNTARDIAIDSISGTLKEFGINDQKLTEVSDKLIDIARRRASIQKQKNKELDAKIEDYAEFLQKNYREIKNEINTITGSDDCNGSISNAVRISKEYSDSLAINYDSAGEAEKVRNEINQTLEGINAKLSILVGDENMNGSVANAIKASKDYSDSIAKNFDSIGAAEAVRKDLTELYSIINCAVSTLSGGETEEGSVANLIAQSKEYADSIVPKCDPIGAAKAIQGNTTYTIEQIANRIDVLQAEKETVGSISHAIQMHGMQLSKELEQTISRKYRSRFIGLCIVSAVSTIVALASLVFHYI